MAARKTAVQKKAEAEALAEALAQADTTTAIAAPSEDQSEGLRVMVHSRGESFRRGGQKFTRHPREITLGQVGQENWDAIMNEDQLIKTIPED